MQRVCQYILYLLPLIYWFKKILWGLVQFKKAVELVKFKVVGDSSVQESCWGKFS